MADEWLNIRLIKYYHTHYLNSGGHTFYFTFIFWQVYCSAYRLRSTIENNNHNSKILTQRNYKKLVDFVCSSFELKIFVHCFWKLSKRKGTKSIMKPAYVSRASILIHGHHLFFQFTQLNIKFLIPINPKFINKISIIYIYRYSPCR